MRFIYLITLSITCAIFCATIVNATDYNWEKSEGGFSISLILTDKGRELFETWNKPATQPFTIRTLDIAPRSTFLTAIVMFSGCQKDESGNCNASVDYIVYDPSNNMYGDLINGELWISRPGPEKSMSQLAMDYMGIVIEPKDPSGKYILKAIVTDHLSNRKLEVFRNFIVE